MCLLSQTNGLVIKGKDLILSLAEMPAREILSAAFEPERLAENLRHIPVPSTLCFRVPANTSWFKSVTNAPQVRNESLRQVNG